MVAAAPPTVDIVAVGSEMLTPHRSDTNSLWLTERLGEMGLRVRAKHVVGDDVREIQEVVAGALARSVLVVVCGGLGPTEDDLTRVAVAQLLRRRLVEHAPTLEKIKSKFRRFGMRMPRINVRQAMAPAGAVVLDNPAGTAPGLILRRGKKQLLLLPGPPREMRAVWAEAAPHLGGVAGSHPEVLVTQVLHVVGLTESRVDEIAAPIYRKAKGVSTTILFSLGQIELRLLASGRSTKEAQRRADRLGARLRKAIGTPVFGAGEETLELVVVRELRARGQRVALAESCTGGLVGHRITQVPGASDVLELGIVAYANWAKETLLDVPAELLARHGAVSEPVARAMAEGARRRANATWGLAVTGIAGPTGGSDAKPVGTTHVAVAGPGGATVRELRLPGPREQVKVLASQAALELLRRALLGAPAVEPPA